jgi:beta-lactamase class A
MYIGNDRYIHSSSSLNGVNINSLNSSDMDYKEDLAKTITDIGTIF